MDAAQLTSCLPRRPRGAGALGRLAEAAASQAGFWYRFIRFPVIGASAVLPLVGAATVAPHLPTGQIAALLGVAVAFHIYAYVLNDVADLPVDRTEPLRSAYPLVQGTIQPGQALAFALLQIPLALALTAWRGGGPFAYAALTAGFGLMTVYDLWGKRLRFGPLTDLIQGLSWGAHLIYGAALAAGAANPLTALAAAYVVVFIVLINGVHASLRDLANDLTSGLRSTAILLGARPHGNGFVIPRRLVLYALGLQVALLVVLFAAVPARALAYSAAERAAAAALLIVIALLSLFWLRAALAWAGDHRLSIVAGTLHITLVLGALIALLAFRAAGPLLITMLAVYLLPWLTHLEVLSGPVLGLRLLLTAARRRQRYPRTAGVISALGASWLCPVGLSRTEALARLCRDLFYWQRLVRRFLAQDWAPTERPLRLLPGPPSPGDPLVRQAFHHAVLGREAFLLASLARLRLEPARVGHLGGAALLAGAVLERFPRARACGLELCSPLLGQTRSAFAAWRLGPRADWAAAGGWALPCADSAFDLVIAVDAWESHPKPLALLHECARLLRAGGCLLSGDLFSAAPGRFSAWMELHSAAGLAIEQQWVDPVAEDRLAGMLASVRV